MANDTAAEAQRIAGSTRRPSRLRIANRTSGSRALKLSQVRPFVLYTLLLATLENLEPRYTLECYPMVLLLAGARQAGKCGLTAETQRAQRFAGNAKPPI